MVQLLRDVPVPIYEIFDRCGRAIGLVVDPRGEPVVGQGAGTVLLVRRCSQQPIAHSP